MDFKQLVNKLPDDALMTVEHLSETEELYQFISALDFEFGDAFCFKSGGDGDNGELLMFYLDLYFKHKQGQLDEFISDLQSNSNGYM